MKNVQTSLEYLSALNLEIYITPHFRYLERKHMFNSNSSTYAVATKIIFIHVTDYSYSFFWTKNSDSSPVA